MRFVIKTRQDNDMIDFIGVVHVETETELLGPIEPSMVSYQNETGQQHGQWYRCDLHQK